LDTEENKSAGSGGDLSETEEEYRKIEEEKKKYQEKEEKENNKRGSGGLVFKGVTIKDTDEKLKKRKYIKKILSKEGQFFFEIDDNKKCHCCSNKKYRTCCKEDDIAGDFDKDSEEFFCDIERFLMFYSTQPQEKEDNKKDRKDKNDNISESNGSEKTGDSVATIEKKMASIYI